MSRRTISWSDLPPELLTLVAERLGTRSDTDNFRLVCNRWWVAASYSTHRPQNLLSPICPYKFSFPSISYADHFISVPINFLTLVRISVFLVRSLLNAKLTPWLLTVEESNPGILSQCRPLSNYTEYSQSRLPKKFKFNPSYFAVSEIGRSYELGCESIYFPNKFNKAVLIVDRNCGTSRNIDDYDLVGLNSDGSLDLISLKLRKIRNIYRTIPNYQCPRSLVYDDVVNFQGSAFAVDRKASAYILEHKQGRLRNVVQVPVDRDLKSNNMKKRLAAETCTGELFLVCRLPAKLQAVFKIYKMNDERNKWDEVEGIGDDRILFVASGGCFFAKTKDLPGWRGNSMLFHRKEFRAYREKKSADSVFLGEKGSIHDVGIIVFHFDTGDWEPVVSHPHYFDLFALQPAWLESDAELFNRMSAAEKRIARDLYSRVASEPTSEIKMSVAEGMLAAKEGASARSPNLTVQGS